MPTSEHRNTLNTEKAKGMKMAGSKKAVPGGQSAGDDMTFRKLQSRAMIVAAVPHALVTQAFSQHASSIKLDQDAIRDAIKEKSIAVIAGDMSSSERMLVAQATTLNAICVDLFLRANANLAEYVGAAETYMKLALKAQNQCRMTLETLAAIKNPPVVYARQANFANGPQQVNNGVIPHAAKNETALNGLLEGKHDECERMDGGAPGQAIGSNPTLAAMGTINRAAKR